MCPHGVDGALVAQVMEMIGPLHAKFTHTLLNPSVHCENQNPIQMFDFAVANAGFHSRR